ncbi:MAG TPA: regulatory protein RecX [Humibacter sp.]|nr:regulatory protein RecX [Humibacter sp.]
MVVRFTPTPDGESARPRNGRVTWLGSGPETPAGEHHLAPVSYLPGARPSEAASAALRRVESMRGGDAEPARESTRGASRASNVSMHQLARRGMSRWELQQVLDKRGVDETTARAELDRLQSVGLLDDAALALTLVYTQHTRKGLGRTAIAQELRRRHIEQAIIDDALSEIEDDDELERALELAHKRASQLSSLDGQTARRRLSGYLARKGYASDIIRRAMESALSDDPLRDREQSDDPSSDDDPGAPFEVE